MFDNARVVLSSGAVLACGSDQNIWVSLHDQRVTLPYPIAGIGGGELVVSPDQRHAVLWLYSGQSEVGYELFALVPALRHIAGLPFINGEGVAPVWSPDSRWLAMLVGVTPRLHGTGEWVEDLVDAEAEGQLDADIAELVVVAPVVGEPVVVESGAAALPVPVRAKVHARIPASLDPDVWSEWTFYEPPRFLGDARVAFAVPWGGEVEVELPPVGSIRAPDYEA